MNFVWNIIYTGLFAYVDFEKRVDEFAPIAADWTWQTFNGSHWIVTVDTPFA